MHGSFPVACDIPATFCLEGDNGCNSTQQMCACSEEKQIYCVSLFTHQCIKQTTTVHMHIWTSTCHRRHKHQSSISYFEHKGIDLLLLFFFISRCQLGDGHCCKVLMRTAVLAVLWAPSQLVMMHHTIRLSIEYFQHLNLPWEQMPATSSANNSWFAWLMNFCIVSYSTKGSIKSPCFFLRSGCQRHGRLFLCLTCLYWLSS